MLFNRLHLATATALFLVLIIAYSQHRGLLNSVTSMASTSATPLPPLAITLSPSTEASSILGSTTIPVTIKNLSPRPISFPRWSSPFDGHVGAIGVFTFTSKTTNIPARCLDMKINHRLPTSGCFTFNDERIIHIPGNEEVQRDVVFKEPEVALKKGETYAVKAEGTWKGVWIHELKVAKEQKLYLVDAGFIGSDFESNQIVVEIPQKEGAEL